MFKNLHRLDSAFHLIMETFVARGYGPHFTEIANAFGLTPDEGKALLHELIDTRVMPMWLYPGTDLLVSFAPFNHLPNQYRITVAGQQKWFGQ
jgi:hypothetical protein